MKPGNYAVRQRVTQGALGAPRRAPLVDSGRVQVDAASVVRMLWSAPLGRGKPGAGPPQLLP